MTVHTDFPHAIIEEENVWIEIAGPLRLAARIWRPDNSDTAPVPAILEYLPYRKRDGTAARDALTHPWFAGHGYACVRVDIRGNGESDGLMTDEYTEQELDDAVQVIGWLTEQSWCDGNVGMIGISWGGFNGLQVAALQPPALKAVVSLCSTDDRFADDIHFKGGCLLNENLGWGTTMLSYSSRPPDPVLAGNRWRDMWLERLENQPLLIDRWLSHQKRDAYWRHGSICEDFSRVSAAVLAVGGWGDAYSNAVFRLLHGLGAPAKGIVGPWVHKYPHFAVPEPRIGFLQEALRWWDRWLKGEDNGVEDDPDLRVYVMESVAPQTWYNERPGRWLGVELTGLAAPPHLEWHLAPGRLTADPAPSRGDVLVATPETCGADGGEYCAIWLGPDWPGDQRRDDAVSATFDSPPLDEALDILGAADVSVTVRADKPFANLAVRLNDVRPDGSVARISYGVLNLRHRRDPGAPEAVVPGEAMTIRVKLDDIGYRLPAGHRLRLSVSTSYWPLIWPSPEPVTLTLETEGAMLTIPTAQGGELGAGTGPFEAPQSSAPLRLASIREGGHRRTLSLDQGDGTATLDVRDDFGEERDPGTGLTTGGHAREVFRIAPHDPLCASMEATWEQTLARDGWSVRTQAFARMTSDATHFTIEARVDAWEGGEQVHTRSWLERIAREHV